VPLASLLPLAPLLRLTLLLPLLGSMLWLRSILLALRSWRLLLMLDYGWLWTLRLAFDCRASLVRRRWRAGTLVSLPLTLRRLRLRSLLLIVRAHYGVFWLIAVLLVVQRLLLLLLGISIP
jgi:hypothetical protein